MLSAQGSVLPSRHHHGVVPGGAQSAEEREEGDGARRRRGSSFPRAHHPGIAQGDAQSTREREGGDGPSHEVDQVGHPLDTRFNGATLWYFRLPSGELERGPLGAPGTRTYYLHCRNTYRPSLAPSTRPSGSSPSRSMTGIGSVQT